MSYLPFPYLSLAIGALLAGAGLTYSARYSRRIAVGAAFVAFAALLGSAWAVMAAGHERLFDPLLPLLEADRLDAVPMAFFGALTLVVLALVPKHDAGGKALCGLLLLSAATQTAYGAANLVVLAAGWWLTSLPFLLGLFGPDRTRRMTQGFLIASSVALTIAIVLLHHVEISDLSHASLLTFVPLILAVVLRKGVFPFHGWMLNAFENGPLVPLALMFNGHLGALLIARSETAVLPRVAKEALDLLCMAALVTALITSVRSFAEKKPRRLLGLLCVSQASFILAGIATTDGEGITGALVLWLVVSAASTGLICIARVLEVRVAGAADPSGHLGLAVKAPRLATFFLVCGLALIGLPGTLGYCAEDLLFHGALEANPWLGLALPVATAFNAINLLRLYSLLFLGVLPKRVIDIPDALPRERWPLALCLAFLIVGGIFPAKIISWGAGAAQTIEAAMSPGKPGH